MSNIESIISWLNHQLVETSNQIKELQLSDVDDEVKQNQLEKLYFRRSWIGFQLDNIHISKGEIL